MKERTQYQIQEIRRNAEEWIEWNFAVDFVDNLGTFITFHKTSNPLKFRGVRWDGKEEIWGLGKFTNTMNIWLQNPSTNLQIHKEETL